MASQNPDMDEATSIHPPINNITDALTFQMSTLVAESSVAGGAIMREQFGLSLNEWRVIGLTYALEPATIAKIRKILHMDRGQLSRVVVALTGRDLLSTRPSETDLRSVELSLTPKAAKLHDAVLASVRESNEIVVSALTPSECTEFLRLLKKITVHRHTKNGFISLLDEPWQETD